MRCLLVVVIILAWISYHTLCSIQEEMQEAEKLMQERHEQLYDNMRDANRLADAIIEQNEIE